MRIAAMMCLLPLPAFAELSAPISTALTVCLTEGTSLAARAEALTASGWQILPEKDRATAAQAHAPYELVRLGRLSVDDIPTERAALLVRAAESVLWQIDQGYRSEIWLSAGNDTAVLVLRSRIRTMVECQLAANLSPDLVAAVLNAPLEVQESPPVTFTYFLTGETRLDSPVLMTFATDTFGALPILPILVTPAVASN
jgi:hypothetical protein